MIRTLEELARANYKNLLYGELVEYDLDCKQYCPLYKDTCNGKPLNFIGEEPKFSPCVDCFRLGKTIDENYKDFIATTTQVE